MGIHQLYEKLGTSPEPALSSNNSNVSNSTNFTRSSASTGASVIGPSPEAGMISNETANELQRHVAGIVDSQKALIDCVVAVTNARVSAQRLCYRLDSEAYSFYNNAESREQLKQARLRVMERIRDVQQRILVFDRYICTSVPPAVASGYRKRQRVSAYESKRGKYLRSLRSLVSEFSGLLDQQKRDLKEVCNDYCHFITERYQTVNQYISPQDIKVFITYLEKPLLLPKSTEDSDQLAPELANNPYIKTIVTEILYRRQDLHLILDTLRLIDSVSPAVKVIEHRFILNSFSQGCRDHDYDDAEDLLSDSDSESLSDASEDLVVIGQPKSLVQRVLGIFGARGKRHDYLLEGSDDDDDDDNLAGSKEHSVDSGEGVDEEADQRYRRGSTDDAHQFLLLSPTTESRPSFLNRFVHATSSSSGRRHLIMALLLLLGTVVLILIMLAEVLHF